MIALPTPYPADRPGAAVGRGEVAHVGSGTVWSSRTGCLGCTMVETGDAVQRC